MLNINFIGRVTTEFPEKFGVPKQPQLIPNLKGVLRLEGEYKDPNYLKGLESCSHLWVLFFFHLNKPHSGSTVRPPVLGGEERKGVFSTRTPHRPNPIGLSLLKIDSLDLNNCLVHVSGHDLVDGTPIIDIKPYIMAYDFPSEENFHWSNESTQTLLKIRWTELALEKLNEFQMDKHVIESILALDPRPRSKNPDAQFGFYFLKYNILFSGNTSEIVVFNIIKTN